MLAWLSVVSAGALQGRLAPHVATPAACSRTPTPCMAASAGQLLRVSHAVADVAATASFYEACLGLSSTPATDGADSVVLGAESGGLRLELVAVDGGGFQPNAGYGGLSACVPSVSAALAAAVESGGRVLCEQAVVEHGPSMVPDEPEETTNPLTEAIVADPSGYPLLLHEADAADQPTLSGVKLDVYEYKTSQEWSVPARTHCQRARARAMAALTSAPPVPAPVGTGTGSGTATGTGPGAGPGVGHHDE